MTIMTAWWLASALLLQASAELDDLREPKQEILAAIEDSPFEQPIHLTSKETSDSAHGHVNAIVDTPFDQLSDYLGNAADWCEILFLHLNVKSCVYEAREEDATLRAYIGRKHYQEPHEAERSELDMHVHTLQEDAMRIDLEADSGPYGTREFYIRLLAIPLDEKQSLLQFQYSAGFGAIARTAMDVYFAVAGGDRIGFTIENDDEESPEYIGGLRGMIERNSVRFYLALQAYLEKPEADQLGDRLLRWHDLTEQHPEQLRELDRDTYLSQKLEERENQERLQDQETDR